MRFISRSILCIPMCTVFSIGTQFLTIPSNGIELSTGSNMVLENGSNPSSLSMGKKMSLNFSYGDWLANSKVSALKITIPKTKSSFAIDLKYVNLGALELRTERPSDDYLAHYNASGASLGGSYSKDYGRLSGGAAIRLIRIDLHTENSNGIAFDLGANYQISQTMELGAALLNIGTMSELKKEKPSLPVRLLMTGNFILNRGSVTHNFSMTGEWSGLRQNAVAYVSTSSHLKGLIVRFGSKLSKNVLEIRSGVGFSFGMYRLNYGVCFGSQDLGMPHMIDLSIQLP